MSETRQPYGPTPSWVTTAHYQVVWRDQVEDCKGEFSVEAPDALTAAAEALALVKTMAGKHKVTNLVLQVSLEI